MRQSILSLIFMFISFSAWSQANPDLTCASVAAASCNTNQGVCMDFFSNQNTNTETWKNVCTQSNGVYASAPCNRAQIVLTCLNKNNAYTPMMHYSAPMTAQNASMLCTYMGGTVCPR